MAWVSTLTETADGARIFVQLLNEGLKQFLEDRGLWVRAEHGIALVDQTVALASDLTTRPVAGVQWMIDTAFVHHSDAEHVALPFVVQFAQQMSDRTKRKRGPSKQRNGPVQLQLLA